MASSLDGVDLPLLAEGKVRRLYRLPDQPGHLLMVATDRISAHDHVLTPEVPGKGIILTQLSVWWFDRLRDVVDTHLVSAEIPQGLPGADALAGRSLVVEELEMVPVECVVRGHLTGSGLAEYRRSGRVCGVELPEGLEDGSPLPEPIFTPARKAPLGDHDENITFDQLVDLVGPELAETLRRVSLALFTRASSLAAERGILLADTKFEFGRRPDGSLVLADEVLTPDSSRYWDATTWAPGRVNESFDKQPVRDWLSRNWDGRGEPPALPDEVVEATRARYVEAWTRLTGAESPLRGHDEAAAALADLATDSAHLVDAVPANDRMRPMARVVVDVMPKPEILDPQGKAITGVLERRGHSGLTVRQGKRFEITGEGVEGRLDEITRIAEEMLANTVIESYDIHVEH